MKTKLQYIAYGRNVARGGHALPAFSQGSWQRAAFFEGYDEERAKMKTGLPPKKQVVHVAHKANLRIETPRLNLSTQRTVDLPRLQELVTGFPGGAGAHLQDLASQHNVEDGPKRRTRLYCALLRICMRHASPRHKGLQALALIPMLPPQTV